MVSIGGMFFNFSALARLPIVDVTAIRFGAADDGGDVGDVPQGARAQYRWWAVIVGFIGIW